MAVYLMNSAVLTSEGVYKYHKVSPEEARKELEKSLSTGEELISAIGYPETAHYMTKVLGVKVEVSRLPVKMKEGDIAIICKLAYRPQDPSKKGSLNPSANDYEWGILKKVKECSTE